MDGNCRAVIVTAALHSPALKGAFPFAVKGKLSACLQATCQAPAYTCQAPAYKQGNLTALLRHVQMLVLCFNTQGSCEEGGRKEGRKEGRRKGRKEGRVQWNNIITLFKGKQKKSSLLQVSPISPPPVLFSLFWREYFRKCGLNLE